jgi:hypothetical protein
MSDGNRYTFHTYRNKEEYNKFVEEKSRDGSEVLVYNYEAAFDHLPAVSEAKVYIDITAFVELIRFNKQFIQGFYYNIIKYENKEFIIKEDLKVPKGEKVEIGEDIFSSWLKINDLRALERLIEAYILEI